MNEKFFPELARRLRQMGVATGPAEKTRLLVLMDGHEAMYVEPHGSIVITAKFMVDPEASRIYETVRGLCSPVYE